MSSNVETKVKQLASLVLQSEAEAVNEVITVLEDLRETHDFKEDVHGSLVVAVSEAINNSVFHGNKQDPQKKVYVDIELRNQYRLVVRVKDEGNGFNPDALEDPVSPENLFSPGGRGVYFMRTLADEVVFHNEGREVELVFNI